MNNAIWVDERDVGVIRSKIRTALKIYVRAEFGGNVHVSRKTALEALAESRTGTIEASLCTMPSGDIYVFLHRAGAAN